MIVIIKLDPAFQAIALRVLALLESAPIDTSKLAAASLAAEVTIEKIQAALKGNSNG